MKISRLLLSVIIISTAVFLAACGIALAKTPTRTATAAKPFAAASKPSQESVTAIPATATAAKPGSTLTPSSVTERTPSPGATAAPARGPASAIGLWAVVPPAADASGRQASLLLAADGSVTLISRYSNRNSTVASGLWKGSDQNTQAAVQVSLNEQDGKAYKEEMVLDLKESGLTASSFDKTKWGAKGFSATRITAGSLRGAVTYRERIALPPDAVVSVQLQDLSKTGAPTTILAHQVIAAAGKQAPFVFDLIYDPGVVKQDGVYGVVAKITVGGQVRWTNTTHARVLTAGAPSDGVEVVVQQAN
jgi:uncharacterized lipoprotein YbaY